MLPAIVLHAALLIATPVVDPVAPSAAAQPARTPRWRGVGLGIAAGVTGAIGLVGNIARIGVVQSACADIGASSSNFERAVTDCIQDTQAYITLSALAPLANSSALGLASGAGVMNGRYRGWQTHGDGRSASAAYIGVGAGLFGVSVLAYVVSRIGIWRDLYGVKGCLTQAEFSGDCVRARWSGWLGAIAVSQSGAVVGAGLFAFGVSYRIHGRRHRASLTLQPALSLAHAGVRLTGRF